MHPTTEALLTEAARRVAEASAATQTAIARRDRLIVEAFDAGAPLREIARVAGLTHPRVLTIVRRHQRD